MIHGLRYFFPSLLIARYKVGLLCSLCVLVLSEHLLIFLFVSVMCVSLLL